MRPEKLPIRIRDGEITPGFLGDLDVPWLRALLELARAHEGERWRELDVRLSTPVLDRVPLRRQALAASVLRRLLRAKVRSPVLPRRARSVVFGLAAASRDRTAVLAAAAQELGIAEDEVLSALLADLPGERAVTLPARLPGPADLAALANLLLCKSLLSRATEVEIDLFGNARAVVRLARLRGLICTISRPGPDADPGADRHQALTLSLSGPMSLFRRTTLYGRALGDLVPALGWCDRFSLRATCLIADREATLRLGAGDPIRPGAEGRRFDSLVEKRLARDLGRLASDWTVVREPEPIAALGSLLFPDFALTHRYDPTRRWLLEIVGFWTPDYLERKLASYRAASIDRLILCIDERLDCGDGDLPARAHIIRYRKRVDAGHIVALIGDP